LLQFPKIHMKCTITSVTLKTAVIFLLCSVPSGDAVSRIPLRAGDDAGAVAWMEASSSIQLYASHLDFIKEVVRRRNANWDS